MTCAPQHQSFRLLDARTGWEAASSTGLTGLGDAEGIRLAAPTVSPDAVHLDDVLRCLNPPELAADPSGRLFRVVGDDRTRVQVRQLASGGWSDLALPDPPVSISALSWGRGILAVADAGAGRVLLLRGTPPREVLRIELAGQLEGRPHLVAVTPWSMLAVVTRDPAQVALVGMDGLVRRRDSLPAAAAATELGMAWLAEEVDERPALLLAVRLERGWRRLLRLAPDTLEATVVPASALRCCLPAAVRVEAGDDGTGRIDPCDDPEAEPVRRYLRRGRLRTTALDSGADDCEWHRIRLDADQPAGTGVSVRLAVLDGPADQPGDQDWQDLPPGAGDALVVRRPRGRYLRLELELFGDGRDTPVVRAVRADFNVATSLARLPAVYRTDPAAAGFTKRFLSLFDATFEDLDEVVALAPLLLDPAGLPDHVLPALAARIGVRADPSWTPERLRRLLAAWPRVSPLLGTPRGLRRLVAILHGVDVLVEESGRLRPWGSFGQAHLGQVRLFGLSRASLRLGSGRLGEALMEPGADLLGPAYGSGAHRCVVHVPAHLPASERPALEALVRAFLPAHVSVSVRYAAPAVRIGPPLAVGVATRLGRLDPGVLGGGGKRAVVLGRRGVLGGARDGGALVTVGRRAVAGITR